MFSAGVLSRVHTRRVHEPEVTLLSNLEEGCQLGTAHNLPPPLLCPVASSARPTNSANGPIRCIISFSRSQQASVLNYYTTMCRSQFLPLGQRRGCMTNQYDSLVNATRVHVHLTIAQTLTALTHVEQ